MGYTTDGKVCGYKCFVRLIRSYFKKYKDNPHKGLTPFKAEFYIWPEMQWIQAAEAFRKQGLFKKLQGNSALKSALSSGKINNDEIFGLVEEVEKTIPTIKAFYQR